MPSTAKQSKSYETKRNISQCTFANAQHKMHREKRYERFVVLCCAVCCPAWPFSVSFLPFKAHIDTKCFLSGHSRECERKSANALRLGVSLLMDTFAQCQWLQNETVRLHLLGGPINAVIVCTNRTCMYLNDGVMAWIVNFIRFQMVCTITNVFI